MASKQVTLEQTVNHMKELLAHITQDLHKAEGGNKAAAQRVRTGTIRLEKTAKMFRKESVKAERNMKGTEKNSKKPANKNAKAKSSAHAKHTPAKAPSKVASKAAPKAAPKADAKKKKAVVHKTVSRARALSLKRTQTAKLLHKKMGAR